MVTLESQLPANITPALRLKEYLSLVRALSVQTDPFELLAVYRSRAHLIVPHDHVVTVTSRGLKPGQVSVIRSSMTGQAHDPFAAPEKLPRITTGLLCQMMAAGRPVKIDELQLDSDDPLNLHMAGMKSVIAAPIFVEGEPQVVVVMGRRSEPRFELEDLSTLLLTVNLIGQASNQLRLAERLRAAYAELDRETRVVGEIQRDLLPKVLPDIPGLSVATHYETSTRAGGDYYDFLPLCGGRWGVLIADVSGHGAPAAVVMAMMHAILHGSIEPDGEQKCAAPGDVLTALNTRLYRFMRAGNFVTAFYGVLDPRARTLRYAMAGHDPPRLLRRASQHVEGLPLTEGWPLAIESNMAISESVVQFETGDRLLLYTDGITETFSVKGEMFGLARLDEALLRCQYSAASMVDCVLADVRGFSRGLPPRDDRTLVALAFD